MIKFVFRWAFRLLLLAIVLVIGFLLLKDNLARGVAEQRIRLETGFDAKIGKMEVGLLSPVVRLEDFVLYSPADFGGAAVLKIPELHVEYDPKEAAFQRVRFKLVRLSVEELHIVENNAGRTNIIDLMHKISPDIFSKPARKQSSGTTFLGVDMLNLSVGKVRYTNLRRPERSQEIQLRMENEIVQNLRTENDLAAVLLKILLRAGITIYTDHPRPVKL